MNSQSPSKIMLVEDSVAQATHLSAILEQAGWQVTWVTSAQEAFEKLRESNFDLVLLDFHLPGMRGDEVCRRIRMNINSRNLLIVILTAEDTSEVELMGLESGADDFITKSVDSDMLLVRIRTLLAKTNRQSEILAENTSAFRSARLLAIDDSPTFLERLRPELESEGYEVETAVDPDTGLKRVREESFDGVIIDLVMPGMNGIELCRRIDQLRTHAEKSLVTVMLTANETKEDHSRALEAGADDFIGKSSEFSVLKGRIRALLRRKTFEEENRRILAELREKELEAVRERAAKEAAEARAALVDQLEQTTEELRQSQTELRRASEAKDQFLAVLSHELRTPLTPVLATVSMRQEDPNLPQEIREELSMIRRNVELEARLIDDLLDLTRITRGKLEIRRATVDMLQIVSHAIEICRAPESPAIVQNFDAGQAIVWGDASRLTQVLWNLLRNAVKFTPGDGRVSVRVFNELSGSTQARCVVVEVTDNGVGIEPDVLPRIFNAFEQGGQSVTRQFGGLGLGLAISKALVELHDGSLSAHSEGRGRGATFRLSLPVTEVASTTDLVLPVCAPPENLPRTSVRQRPLHILLVEDHRDTADTLKRLLIRRGHRVTTAANVAGAAQFAREGDEFDLLISDLGLPDGSGYDVLREVTQSRPVSAIALSGYGMEEDVRKSREAGFKVHITKPVDILALDAAISQLSPTPFPT